MESCKRQSSQFERSHPSVLLRFFPFHSTAFQIFWYSPRLAVTIHVTGFSRTRRCFCFLCGPTQADKKNRSKMLAKSQSPTCACGQGFGSSNDSSLVLRCIYNCSVSFNMLTGCRKNFSFLF